MADTVSKNQRDMILKWHKDGYSEYETARLLKLPVALVLAVIAGNQTGEQTDERNLDTRQDSLF